MIMYMHLIGNVPAFFSKSDGQICYADLEHPVILRKTLHQIKHDQSITVKNRTKWGYRDREDSFIYSYIKVSL